MRARSAASAGAAPRPSAVGRVPRSGPGTAADVVPLWPCTRSTDRYTPAKHANRVLAIDPISAERRQYPWRRAPYWTTRRGRVSICNHEGRCRDAHEGREVSLVVELRSEPVLDRELHHPRRTGGRDLA